MSEHDKFCDSRTHESWCDCRKIDVIRADERERIAQAIVAAHGGMTDHNHITRDIKPLGAGCAGCDEYHINALQMRIAELRDERDAARADADHWHAQTLARATDVHNAIRERDAARAEVDRLRGLLEQVEAIARGMVAQARREVLADLRTKVEALPYRTWVPPHATDCPRMPGKRGICTCGDSLRASDWMLRADVLALIEEAGR